MGRVEGPMEGGKRYWIGENLWGCRECKYGSNRFVVKDGELEAMEL